jgi:large subunit ribosomal protein L37Ae
MAEATIPNTTKRYGTRYGATLKRRLNVIEHVQRADQRCPSCNRLSAKWKSVGMFECRKCGAKFTGEAWGVRQKVTFAEAAVDDTKVEEEETVEEAS